MKVAMTRTEQLRNLSAFYRANHESECADAIDWALAELAQRDQMLSESIDRQMWLEATVEALQRRRAA